MSQKLGKQRNSLTCPRCSWEDMNTGRESKYMLFPSPHLNQNKRWASARWAPLWSLRTVRLGHPCLENSCKYVFLSETPTQRPPARWCQLCWLVGTNDSHVPWATLKLFLQEPSHKMDRERRLDIMMLFPQTVAHKIPSSVQRAGLQLNSDWVSHGTSGVDF